MKKETHLDIWAEEIIKKTDFILEKEIYRGYYYTPDKIRNLILSGSYKGKPAVLKIYDDPRLGEEPNALNIFNKSNKSKILTAPKIYKYKIVSLQKGWFIMEKFSEKASCFSRPVKPEQRREITNLYLEYRKNFPIKPVRELVLAENLTAHQFHIFRISRWLELCTNKEAERMLKKKKPILDPKRFIPKFEKGLDLIHQEFKNRKMIWCHGHFNPAELFKIPNKNLYYLIDFAHAHMYPEGYEFGFIIWSDWIMHANWRMDYREWRKGISDWIEEFRRINKRLKIKRFESLIRASLVERCFGTILADICATNISDIEKRGRIKMIYKFLDELLIK
jgi:hypothetical protein